MMLVPLMGGILGLVLATGPAEPEKAKLVVMEITPAGGVSEEMAGALTDALTAELDRRGYFSVLSSKDIQAIIGAERQRQMLGCAEESTSCLTELAGALGARLVLNGSLAKLGQAYQLTLQTLDTYKAQPIGRAVKIANDLETLSRMLPYVAAEATSTPLPEPPARVLPYSLLGLGGAAFIGGGLATFHSVTREGDLAAELRDGMTNPSLLRPLERYREEEASIALERGIGVAVMAAGALLGATGIWLMPAALPAAGGVALVPTARGVALVGVFQ